MAGVGTWRVVIRFKSYMLGHLAPLQFKALSVQPELRRSFGSKIRILIDVTCMCFLLLEASQLERDQVTK